MTRSEIMEATREMFGEMRNTTEEENQSYSEMIQRLGEDTGISIWDDDATSYTAHGTQKCNRIDADTPEELTRIVLSDGNLKCMTPSQRATRPSRASFTHIQAHAKPGDTRSANSLTEDALAANQNVLLVMDGATIVNGDDNHFRKDASDAHWLAYAACSDLLARFSTISEKQGGEQEILQAIRESIDQLQTEYEKATGRDTSTLTPADVPSTTLTACIISGETLYVIQLGDSPASVKMRDGKETWLPGDANLAALDAENKKRIADILNGGTDMQTARACMFPHFDSARRNRCNNESEGSYRIYCFAGKQYATPYIHAYPAKDVESVAICTDGYAQLLDFEDGLATDAFHDETLEAAGKSIERLTRHQEADASCTKVPRFKKRDDIAVVCARIDAG